MSAAQVSSRRVPSWSIPFCYTVFGARSMASISRPVHDQPTENSQDLPFIPPQVAMCSSSLWDKPGPVQADQDLAPVRPGDHRDRGGWGGDVVRGIIGRGVAGPRVDHQDIVDVVTGRQVGDEPNPTPPLSVGLAFSFVSLWPARRRGPGRSPWSRSVPGRRPAGKGTPRVELPERPATDGGTDTPPAGSWPPANWTSPARSARSRTGTKPASATQRSSSPTSSSPAAHEVRCTEQAHLPRRGYNLRNRIVPSQMHLAPHLRPLRPACRRLTSTRRKTEAGGSGEDAGVVMR